MKHLTLNYLWLILLVFVGLGGLYYYFGFGGGLCDNQVIAERGSRDQLYVVRELTVDCGATTDYATQFFVKNVETSNQVRVLSVKGYHPDTCDTTWLSDSSLRIDCTGNISMVYNQRKNFENVQINFYLNGKLNEDGVVVE